jgi:hypothetical protein
MTSDDSHTSDDRREFGNDPKKIEAYQDFWKREPVKRPIIGFSKVGWFPVEYFGACKSWNVDDLLQADMIDPGEWLDDQERLIEEGDVFDDDILRGVCPTQVALPVFLPATFGCDIRVLPNTVLAEERALSWDHALLAEIDSDSPWMRCYLSFIAALVERANGRYPVSHGAELGPSDLHAVLRGHNQALFDLVDSPLETAQLLMRMGKAFAEFTRLAWEQIPLYHGGYFDAQYQLWAPGPIARLQEDASASFSPEIYRSLVRPTDEFVAASFECCFMHVHTTSLHLLDAILEVENLTCLEINLESFNIPNIEMMPFFQRVQAANRSLIIRGSVTAAELRLFLDHLDPAGLYLHILVDEYADADELKAVAGM